MTDSTSSQRISDQDGFDVTKDLFGSSNRVDFLQELSSKPRSRGEIISSLDISLTTFRRLLHGENTFEGFESMGWVEETDIGYQLSRAGERCGERTEAYVEEIERTQDLGEFLRLLPDSDQLDITTEQLLYSDFKFVETDGPNLLQTVGKQLEKGSRIRGISPLEDYWLVKEISRRTQDGMEGEIVFSPETTHRLEAEYPENWPRIYDAETVQVKVSSDMEIPFPMAIIDGTVIIGAQTEKRSLDAVLTNSPFEMLQWATEKFQTYWKSAEDYKA